MQGAGAQAQTVYRVVGADGKVTFTDRPANQGAQASADTAGSASAAGSSANAQLPYELRQIANRYPVLLYSAKDCQPCEEARSFLRGRGIPFGERTVESNADIAALKKLSGQDSLPFATIGNQHLKGFGEDSWNQYLNAAGYPARSQLPASYRAPAPRPLTTAAPAAPAEPAKAAERQSAPAAGTLPPGTPTPSNPAGLRF
ncbi:glutaredoxin domain-containing protein [Comamonas guangdongensis]|uniref:Glutaredoxin domain-containing protein n=1 Tax=Comamonas guangdongensis TaxID=510515 RepID=A0ABV3ZX65_9BURK